MPRAPKMTGHAGNPPPIPTMRWPSAWASRPGSAWLQEIPGRRSRLRGLFAAAVRGLPPSAVVYDVGGGTGYALAFLAASYLGTERRTCLLAEPQRAMLLRPYRREKYGGPSDIRRVQADGVALPFPDGSAELVLSIGVLCCTAAFAVPRAIGELHRVLAPGGRLAFAVPVHHLSRIVPALRAEGFGVLERFGRNRILFAKG